MVEQVLKVVKDEGKKPTVTFVSAEPLSELIHIGSTAIDWLIIGGRSKSNNMPEAQPKWDWVEYALKDARKNNMLVYFKPNLTIKPKETPVTKEG